MQGTSVFAVRVFKTGDFWPFMFVCFVGLGMR
jgi:hypothetical protein